MLKKNPWIYGQDSTVMSDDLSYLQGQFCTTSYVLCILEGKNGDFVYLYLSFWESLTTDLDQRWVQPQRRLPVQATTCALWLIFQASFWWSLVSRYETHPVRFNFGCNLQKKRERDKTFMIEKSISLGERMRFA